MRGQFLLLIPVRAVLPSFWLLVPLLISVLPPPSRRHQLVDPLVDQATSPFVAKASLLVGTPGNPHPVFLAASVFLPFG